MSLDFAPKLFDVVENRSLSGYSGREADVRRFIGLARLIRITDDFKKYDMQLGRLLRSIGIKGATIAHPSNRDKLAARNALKFKLNLGEMNMRQVLLAAISGLLISFAPVISEAKSPPYFDGELKLGPKGCENKGKCIVQQDFGYVDRYKVGWKVNKGFETDGASIPRWAQWFAGEPFEPTYLQAAVLHDWYSKSVRPVYGWLQTQRMFREVLLQSGVSLGKANLLYSGVLAGSGKWIYRKTGRTCKMSDPNIVCMQDAGRFELVREPEKFGTDEFSQIFSRLKAQQNSLDIASAEEVEALVNLELGSSVYLEEKDGVIETNIEYLSK